MILRPGTFLQDRYEILEPVGSGGMSTVYKAKCHKLNRLVAIKVLKDEFSNDSNFVSKFKMEAQAAAGLSHPNIVSVYDVIDEGRIHYIVMELIEGITLKSYITKKGCLEIKESIGIAIQVAQGMQAAHEQHIIHRDIKPQNMIISRDGKVKVADFGIARAVSAQTLTSTAMGSVHYISPEQARGGFSDERSDIYSLGVTMYEMVTGHLPFDGDNTVAIALAHLEDAVIPPSVYNPDIPIMLERVILRCMEKKPDRRYANAAELIADLRKCLLHPETKTTKVENKSGSVKSETVVISKKDLDQIKERSKSSAVQNGTVNLTDAYKNETAASDQTSRRADRKKTEENLKGNLSGKRKQKQSDDDGINTSIERILAGAGIVTAIIIVAVLLTIVTRLGGAFSFGSPESVETNAQGEEISLLGDTEIYMPDLYNMPEDMAEEQLKKNYITMKCSYEYFDDVEKGRIARQDPKAGEIIPKGSHVNVVVSNGSDKLDLSSLGLANLDATSARNFLENKNLKVHVVEEENETVEKGKVVRYEPEAVAEGGTVTLYISSGPHVAKIPVPQLVGIAEEDAIVQLGEAGLKPGDVTAESSDTVPQGHIIRQSGASEDGMIEVGGTVDYVVSSGPPEVKMQRYVASINEVYDMSSLVGPGAGSYTITVMVRLRQGTEEAPVYKVLTQATPINGDVLLPISYTSIESMNGTDQGVLEVVDVETGAVLRTYPLTFFPMD
ncbi:MAG: Stk1 family PASTA domain-containing Ser/Thr kinase [Brotaphodocola sp.]